MLLAAALFALIGAGPPRIPGPCTAGQAHGRGALLERNNALTHGNQRLPATAAHLIELGCVRWRLWQDLAIAREGPGMPLGESWLHGAVVAAWTASTLEDPQGAAALMAALAEAEGRRIATPGRAEAAWQMMQRSGDPVARNDAARVCTILGEWLPDASRHTAECATVAMAADPSSIRWPLELSRARAMLDDTAAALAAWRQAAAMAPSGDGWPHLLQEVRWFATAAEWDALAKMASGGRSAELLQLIELRDARTGEPHGSYLVTHFQRLAHARAEFALKVPRGQERRFENLSPTSSSVEPDAASDDSSFAGGDWREMMRWQHEVDDRGVIFVRHGAPDLRLSPVRTGRTLELWAYTRTSPPLSFQFEEEDYDGSVAATRLVVGRYGEHWCGIDVLRCVLGMRGRASPEQLEQLRRADREMIAVAGRFDTPAAGNDVPATLVARGFRMWDPVDETPVLVVAYAVPWLDSLRGKPLPIRLRVRMWGGGDRDTTIARLHQPPPAVDGRQADHAVGFLVLPRDAEASTWSGEVTGADRVRRSGGRNDRQQGIRGVMLSDIITATEHSPLRWDVLGDLLPVDPGGRVGRSEPLSLYYQIRRDGPAREVTTRIALWQLDPNGIRLEAPALEIALSTPIEPGLNHLAPLLDISQLAPGRYGLEIRLQDPDDTVLASSWVAVEITE